MDSSDSEGFSDDEDFEAELQAALLLSAEDQGGPPPPSEFSEDTRSPRRQTQYLDRTVDLVSPPSGHDRQRGLSNTELAMAAAGTNLFRNFSILYFLIWRFFLSVPAPHVRNEFSSAISTQSVVNRKFM